MNTATLQAYEPQTSRTIKKPTRSSKCIDRAYLESMAQDDTTFLVILLSSFRNTAGQYLRKIQHQLGDQDYSGLSKTASLLMPVGVYVGANELTVIAGELKEAAAAVDKTAIKSLVSQVRATIEDITRELTKMATDKQ